MPNYRERSNGERPDEFRLGQRRVAGSDMSRGDVLVEEPPGIGREDLLLRQEWQLALRIVASKGFCKSELLQKFLLYVCEQQLLGNTHEITEQRIGTQIFNRTTDYNPGEDNIVRSYARLLRKRLDKYFEGEGLEEPLRINIPRGGYVPVFVRRADVQEPFSKISRHSGVGKTELGGHFGKARGEPEAAAEVRQITSGTRWQPAWLSVFAGLLAGVLLASAGWIGTRMLQEKGMQEPAHLVWKQLFQRNRTTLIVPADSGLGILQNLTGQLVTLEEYANGTYLSDVKSSPGLGLENLNDLRRQRYTSVVDLNITAMLARLPESAESQSEVRYARSITTEDLKSSNAILLGSTHTNPWVSLFEKNLNFKLEYMPEVDRSFVLNEHPVGAEQKRYVNGTGTANRTYGVIDYLPSLDGTGHVLIIQGLNMAATQAAADTLFSSEEMKPILKQVVRPDRSVKSFELLVETSSIGATAPGAQIIATRFYP
ncbi:hypothetical protein RBB77_05920 [Tunturibacter psychrotolerans]|uniref:Uncharacterized protein n=1 Tax=Tunturiibacter psychrotolerans TaxID=3069686 RepID=A0AAU7ZU73_9BACT